MLTITHTKAGTDFPGSELLIQSKGPNGSVAQWWGYVAN
jgi:hypothetical protein